MDTRNEIAFRDCRFLSEEHFHELYATFTEAFSDYVFPFELTETQFRNHILLTGVDLRRTVGCFNEGNMVGFSLNGFGNWNGRKTVYDAGTGVIPSARRQGVSNAIFEMMLPRFKATGFEQLLLEVITSNVAAIALYEKLGFEPVRELALLQCDGAVQPAVSRPNDVLIEEMFEPDRERFTAFWDGKPSWQNSNDAMRRSGMRKRTIGAFIDGRCVGYASFSANFGRIAQMAVDPSIRNRGIGTLLLQRIFDLTPSECSLQVINIDKSITSAVDFFRNRGFYERVAQYEMVMPF